MKVYSLNNLKSFYKIKNNNEEKVKIKNTEGNNEDLKWEFILKNLNFKFLLNIKINVIRI